MRRLVFCFWFALLSFGAAQTGGSVTSPQTSVGQPSNGQLLSVEADIIAALNAATEELMIATPQLLAPKIADAVRVALVERGVSVYILSPTEGIEAPASYLASLSLAGAALRVAPAYEPFIVIDRQSVLAGALISEGTKVPGQSAGATFLTTDATYAAPFVESFYASFDAAQPYDIGAFLERQRQTFIQEEEGP